MTAPPDPGSAQGAEASTFRRFRITAIHPFRDRVDQTDGPGLRLRESVSLVSEEWHRAEVARLVEEAKRETVREVVEAVREKATLWQARAVYGAADFIEREFGGSASLAQRPSEAGDGKEE